MQSMEFVARLYSRWKREMGSNQNDSCKLFEMSHQNYLHEREGMPNVDIKAIVICFAA